MTSGLRIAFHQSFTTNTPWLSVTPVGVCIQEFATRIHRADRPDDSATLNVAKRCIFLLILPQPKIISPMKPASYMKAVIVS